MSEQDEQSGLEDLAVPLSEEQKSRYDELENQDSVQAEQVEDDTLVLDYEQTNSDDVDAPLAPDLKECKFNSPNEVHVLGDLHGWAPGLITYLVEHKLASIEINGVLLGENGVLDTRSMMNVFARTSNMDSLNLPSAGLRGRPNFDGCVNGHGHGSIRARWTGKKSQAFIQLGDVIDRADHSELACEILRQLLIDAPCSVFVLVGNHEQFVLEDEYDNWYLNERRNAITDGRIDYKGWSKSHLRFMETIDLDHEEMSRLVFESYKESVQLLYLTQAAVQQECLDIDHGLHQNEIEKLLSSGWAPYTEVGKISNRFETKGNYFPGALSALVLGETLFHHAEPSQKISKLVSEMNWNKSFGWLNYVHGGNNLQASPHSHLLWSRGASEGSSDNRPASESMLEQISLQWPGLYNIVHGHTPTVTIPEFEDVTNNESIPVSYLAESIETTPRYGRASRIRIFNIDEGMSPVYYKGSEDPEDPCRLPVGLRIAKESMRLSPLIGHDNNDEFFNIDKRKSVRTDTRKLWVWNKGTIRSNAGVEWKKVNNSRHQVKCQFDGVVFLVEVTNEGKELLSRSLSGYPLLENLLVNLLNDANFLPSHIKRAPPKSALKHIRVDNGRPHFEHLLNLGESWKTAKALGLVAIGLTPGNQKHTSNMYRMNFMKKSRGFHILNLDGTEIVESLKSESISSSVILHGEEPFSVSLDLDKPIMLDKLNQWLGETKINSRTEMKIPLCIGMYPIESFRFRKGEKTSDISKRNKKIWERPNKPSDIRDTSQKPKGNTKQNTPNSVGVIKKSRSGKNEAQASTNNQTQKRADIRSQSPQPQKKLQSDESSTTFAPEEKTELVSAKSGDGILPTKEIDKNGKIILEFTVEETTKMARDKKFKNPKNVKLRIEFRTDSDILSFYFPGDVLNQYYHTTGNRSRLLSQKEFTDGVVAPEAPRKAGVNTKYARRIIISSLEFVERALES